MGELSLFPIPSPDWPWPDDEDEWDTREGSCGVPCAVGGVVGGLPAAFWVAALAVVLAGGPADGLGGGGAALCGALVDDAGAAVDGEGGGAAVGVARAALALAVEGWAGAALAWLGAEGRDASGSPARLKTVRCMALSAALRTKRVCSLCCAVAGVRCCGVAGEDLSLIHI